MSKDHIGYGVEPPPFVRDSGSGIVMTILFVLCCGLVVGFMAWKLAEDHNRNKIELPMDPPVVTYIQDTIISLFPKPIHVTAGIDSSTTSMPLAHDFPMDEKGDSLFDHAMAQFIWNQEVGNFDARAEARVRTQIWVRNMARRRQWKTIDADAAARVWEYEARSFSADKTPFLIDSNTKGAK